MARYAYERLSALDMSFLAAEKEHAPMHVAALAVLDVGRLGTEDGGIDIATYRPPASNPNIAARICASPKPSETGSRRHRD